MVRTKNVSALGGGDDEDPPRPFRQVKGNKVYLEQQEGQKKWRMDRVTRAALAAAAAAEQAERVASCRSPQTRLPTGFVALRLGLAPPLPLHLPPQLLLHLPLH
jgi:hypothetical protein